MDTSIIVAAISFVGTLCGAYFGNRRSTALIAYRLEQLEEKVNKHNQVVERTYKLEEQMRGAEHRLEEIERRK